MKKLAEVRRLNQQRARNLASLFAAVKVAVDAEVAIRKRLAQEVADIAAADAAQVRSSCGGSSGGGACAAATPGEEEAGGATGESVAK
jgi:hypothetical protein